ncbi:ATP-grasp domain-containing protein [Salimicrobium flavidum]|uniref:Carbamoyl-phosphate synthase large subunit n=1 Tax=Salimicrobium flavidum TaxID=570947 RepID=A0A1N7IRC4_9BACI|nr:ATP-grasp domain-containing protein [Salimicrobium flavidum]SIS39622.1 carbamoyl-phosphate synthase large subunit [Salimicrobium flavidum]
MRILNVLVTGIGGPTAQGILKGLTSLEDVFIVGADRRAQTTGNHFCDKTYRIPSHRNPAAYKEKIQEIVHKEKIDAIFPSLHEEIDIYKEFREDLPAYVALPASENYSILQDKEQVYKHLEKEGCTTYIPKYFGFQSNEELLSIREKHFPEGAPIVVKQVNGHGSLGFAILMDRPQYLEAMKQGKNKVIQFRDYMDLHYSDRRIAMDHLEGDEYSVDVFIHEGKVIVAVPRLRHGVSNGIVLDGLVVKHEELIEVATIISEKLARSGFMNLQFMHDGNGYKLTDINPRFCGSQVMSLGASVNFPSLFLHYNVKKEYVEVNPLWNTRMMRYRETVFFHDEE